MDWINVEEKRQKALKDDSQFLRCGCHSLTLDLLLYREKIRKQLFFFLIKKLLFLSFFFLRQIQCVFCKNKISYNLPRSGYKTNMRSPCDYF